MRNQAGGMTTHPFSPSNSAKARATSIVSEAHRYPTTRIERLLLFATVALLPLESHFPAVMGFGAMTFVFGVLAIYVLLNRASLLDKVWLHPVLLASYGFLFVAALLELTHPHTDYSEIMRIFQMVLGAIVVASLCRDHSGLRAGLYGWIGAGLWVAIYVISVGYGEVSALNATDFDSASEVRDQVYEGMDLQANLNGLAFFAAQGVVGALALGLLERSPGRRILFLVLMLICLVGAFLPMSRGGVMIVAVASAVVMGTHGILRARILMVLALLAIGIWLVVPEAVFSRLVYKAHSYEPGKLEGRTKVYTAVLESLPEYVITGVGAGNFRKSWASRHGFGKGRDLLGAHNSFAQVTIYWGILGLLGVLAIIWQAYRWFPISCRTSALKLALLGTSVSLLLYMMVMDNLYAKEFSLGLGLLVGANQWIWPRSVGQTIPQGQGNLVPSLRRRS